MSCAISVGGTQKRIRGAATSSPFGRTAEFKHGHIVLVDAVGAIEDVMPGI
ncbi:MAG: hypothetical protein Q8869_00525 [Candidatus Phytoplasma australasiaticum]|nr:hypothetical protein [Candidatus Phytoplasma australasiaticum]